MSKFEPKRADGRSYRDVVVDALKNLEHGTVVTYKTLADAIGIHPTGARQTVQNAARAANKVLLKLHKRGIQSVTNVGYRVLEPREHMIAATTQQVRADRAMVRSLSFYAGTDLTKLTDGERKLHQGQQMLAQAVYASHQHLDKRIKRIEDLLNGTNTVNAD